MANPTNLSAATAIDLTRQLPISFTSKISPPAGTNPALWWSYTAQPTDVVIGLWPFTSLTAGPSGFPFITVWIGPAGSLTPYPLDLLQGTNVPYSIPVTPGTQYFFEVDNGGVDVSGVPPLVLSAVPQPAEPTYAAGDLAVPDETFGFPITILSQTDGHVEEVFVFPSGEKGDILPDGTILAEDYDIDQTPLGLALVNPNLTVKSVLPYPAAFFADSLLGCIRKSYLGGWFVGCQSAGSPLSVDAIVKVAENGTIGGTVWDPPLTSSTQVVFTPNLTDTVLYYALSPLTAAAVKQWDLVNNVALSDLVAGASGYQIQQDLLTLADGSFLVGYTDLSTHDNFVRRYNSSGTILNTYALGTGLLLNRMARGTDDLSTFWVWLYPLDGSGVEIGTNEYRHIRVSDGSVLADFTVTQFEQGNYAGPATATPTARFGPAFSCPFFCLTVGGSGPTPPGPPAGPAGCPTGSDLAASGPACPAPILGAGS